MKILCYMQPHRGGGVARHANTIVSSLMNRAELESKILVSAKDWERHKGFASRWQEGTIIKHPFPEKFIERSWKTINFPKMDRYTNGFDWVYSPAEVRLPIRKTPTAITVHDIQAFEKDLPWSNTPEHQKFRKKWSIWFPKMMKETDKIITVSEFSKNRMVELLGADPNKIHVIGNGVDNSFYRPAKTKCEIDQSRPSVIIIGGLREKKGAAATVKVAEHLYNNDSKVVFDIIGQHEERWARHAQNCPNINLYGYLDDEDIASRLSKSVALLFLTEYEGFGIPALEAMAAGTVAITSNNSSLPEVVGEAGILVDPRNTEEIAELIERLRTDNSFRETYLKKGKEHARKYTWDACTDKLINILRS